MRRRLSNDAKYELLRGGKIEEFNKRMAAGEKPDLTNSDLRDVDLHGLDFSGSYFR